MKELKDRKVKVGRETWTIKFAAQNSTELEGNLGVSYLNNKIIYVSNEQSLDGIKQTLAHELVHACLKESGWNDKISETLGDYYEIFVDNFADKLCDLITVCNNVCSE